LFAAEVVELVDTLS